MTFFCNENTAGFDQFVPKIVRGQDPGTAVYSWHQTLSMGVL